MNALVRIEAVSRVFFRRDTEHVALDAVSLDVESGSFVQVPGLSRQQRGKWVRTMLHQCASFCAIDVRVRSIVGASAFLVLLAAGVTDAQPSNVIEGRRCFGSDSAINDNLPLGATSDATEINRIEGVYVPAEHRLVGWLYTTRNGSAFIQVGPKNASANSFKSAGNDALAAILKEGEPLAYYPLSVELTKAIRRTASIVLAPCYGTGK